MTRPRDPLAPFVRAARRAPVPRRADRSDAIRAAGRSLLAIVLSVLVLLVPNGGTAHELRPAVADLERDGDTLGIALRVNVEALIAGIGPEHEDSDESPQAADYDALRALGAEALRSRLDAFAPRLLAGLELLADGERVEARLAAAAIPDTGDVRVARDSILELEASLPASTTSLTWHWPRDFGPVIVRSRRADGPDAFSVYLLAGETSDPLPLGPADDAGEASTGGAPSGDSASVATAPAPAGTFANYVRVGFVHIVPLGLDHILFVIGLFLLSPRAGPILWQVSAFTLAHSITLALATLELVEVPSRIVEPLIALSITLVCVENLVTTRLHRWRLALVFAFGLLHGLGFASVLADVGGGVDLLTRLIAFNVGVELGQLAVVLLCFALVGWWFRDRAWYHRVVTVPASLAIGGIGLFWFVQRVLG